MSMAGGYLNLLESSDDGILRYTYTSRASVDFRYAGT